MTMLHWLAGKQPPDSINDHAALATEPPETPAPVFAVRAFKQAIFGTPQTEKPPRSPRRNSNTEHTRPRVRQGDGRPIRPSVPRPKSAGDANALFKDLPDAPSSPSKGILLTPGTARAERKTVTFGEGVVDNEGKRPMKSGIPDDCPGKFPSPWSKSMDDVNLLEMADRPKGRSNLTEKLERVREESASKRSRGERPDLDHDLDFGEPQTEEGRYWKAQFDIYRENTQREVKKLVMKQKAAKDFARDRDLRCAEMEDQLKVEKEKSAKLERLAAGLEARLKETDTKNGFTRTRNDARLNRPESHISVDMASNSRPASNVLDAKADLTAGLNRRMEALRTAPESMAPSNQSRQTSRSPQRTTESDRRRTEDIASESADRLRTRTRTENVQAKRNDDIWAQPVASSGVFKPSEKPARPASQTHLVTSPLMPTDITNLPPDLLRRDSAQTSPELAAKRMPSPSHEAFGPTERKTPPLRIAPTRGKPATVTTESEELHISFSSAFDENAPPAPSVRAEHQTLNPAKENMRPTTTTTVGLNPPASGRRVTSNILDKYGKELSEDRIAAARARLLSKGRNVS